MKPWLFDILACPMDKHFPLDLYIFSYETKPEEFKSYIDNYEKRDIEQIKKENIIKITQESGKLLLKDNIIIEKSPVETYIESILSSIDELDNIFDNSSNEISKKCLNIIKSDIKNKIQEFSKNININKIENLLPELFFLNKVKIETEIESGLLFCEKCNRWFPIIETIPQMLPDEYREEKKDINWLKTKKNLLDEKFFKQDLKPFKL